MGVRLKLDRVSQFCYTGVPQAQVEPRGHQIFWGVRWLARKNRLGYPRQSYLSG